MTHAELRFCYRIPSRCVYRSMFGSSYAGGSFDYVESKRDCIAQANPPPVSFHATAATKLQYAIDWLSLKLLTV